MRINELNDEDILNFLMTNDLEGDYAPVELKYLISKWRYLYRLRSAKAEQEKYSYESINVELNREIDKLLSEKNLLQIERTNKQNLIDSMKNRKLSWKERFFGKIITENED